VPHCFCEAQRHFENLGGFAYFQRRAERCLIHAVNNAPATARAASPTCQVDGTGGVDCGWSSGSLCSAGSSNAEAVSSPLLFVEGVSMTRAVS
jgi:hypothetical protein